MATNTTIAGFNVGTDVRFSITDDFGDVFSDAMLGHLTDFQSSADDTETKVIPINAGGIPKYQTLWGGHRGRMRFVRVNGIFQRIFIDLMEAYHASGIISQFSILVNVRNRDGSIDEYLFSGCQWSKPEFGNYQATKEVDMSVNWQASECVCTGAAAFNSFLSNLAAAA